ncbi:MAG: glycosyltransferase family 39 protein, partial [Chloroflexi bacterium]|nr:glycosyltransferase family 39 protein [Chloroflexota bacterium]
ALLWTTYPFSLWLSKQPNSELPFMVFFYASCYLFFRSIYYKRSGWLPYYFSGLLLGFSMLIRPIAVFIPIIFIIFIIFKVKQLTSSSSLLVSVFLLGVLTLVLPWEGYVRFKTGRFLLLSENGAMAIRGGLIFAISDVSYKQEVKVPEDVRQLMEEIKANYSELDSTGRIVQYLSDEFIQQPVTIIKLFAIKTARSWYATDRQSLEGLTLLIQIPYITIILIGSVIGWKKSGKTRSYVISLWVITLYFWSMNILVTSTLRYMVPAIGLLFVLISQLSLSLHNRVGKRNLIKMSN